MNVHRLWVLIVVALVAHPALGQGAEGPVMVDPPVLSEGLLHYTTIEQFVADSLDGHPVYTGEVYMGLRPSGRVIVPFHSEAFGGDEIRLYVEQSARPLPEMNGPRYQNWRSTITEALPGSPAGRAATGSDTLRVLSFRLGSHRRVDLETARPWEEARHSLGAVNMHAFERAPPYPLPVHPGTVEVCPDLEAYTAYADSLRPRRVAIVPPHRLREALPDPAGLGEDASMDAGWSGWEDIHPDGVGPGNVFCPSIKYRVNLFASHARLDVGPLPNGAKKGVLSLWQALRPLDLDDMLRTMGWRVRTSPDTFVVHGRTGLRWGGSFLLQIDGRTWATAQGTDTDLARRLLEQLRVDAVERMASEPVYLSIGAAFVGITEEVGGRVRVHTGEYAPWAPFSPSHGVPGPPRSFSFERPTGWTATSTQRGGDCPRKGIPGFVVLRRYPVDPCMETSTEVGVLSLSQTVGAVTIAPHVATSLWSDADWEQRGDGVRDLLPDWASEMNVVRVARAGESGVEVSLRGRTEAGERQVDASFVIVDDWVLLVLGVAPHAGAASTRDVVASIARSLRPERD